MIGKGGLSSTSRGIEQVNTLTHEGPEHTVSGSCDDSEMGFTPICVIRDREECADHPSTLFPRELNAGVRVGPNNFPAADSIDLLEQI